MMSDPIENPAPSSPLLEPEEKSIGDYALPIALGLGGAFLLYKTLENKKTSDDAEKKQSVEKDQVAFSSKYSSYTIGSEWQDMVLEPFLAEAAEENNLITVDYIDTMPGMTLETLRPLMNKSREEILSSFYATHKVKTPDGEVFISQLPDKSKVREFKKFIDAETAKFQESY